SPAIQYNGALPPDAQKAVTLVEVQTKLKASIRDAARSLFDVHLDQMVSEVPPRTELGDLAFPIAFDLARQIKQKTGEQLTPRAIAEKLKAALETVADGVRVEVAAAGYLNVFFDRARLLADFSVLIDQTTDQKILD